MAYRLRRPDDIQGVGPLDVFRVVQRVQQSMVQVGQRWVQGQAAYQGLAPDPTPPLAAGLHRANVPSVSKVWTELAYEAVRMEVAPEAPSRLTSVFCFADVFEAFSFTEETGQALLVHLGSVEAGASWRLVDMAHFAVAQPTDPDEAGWSIAWEQARIAAHQYWTPSTQAVQYAEILVDGAVVLEPQPVRLIPTMRDLGFIE